MAYNRFNSNASAYGQADRNGDGVLNRNEFRNFFDFQNADRNHDGRVGLAEFAHTAAPNLNIHPRNTAQAFIIADQNHDGVLNQRELADFSDFQRADLNHDGRVDPGEMRWFVDRSFNNRNSSRCPRPHHNQSFHPSRRS
ncbi:hypothetical protein I4U23_009782 [Adineta vaga]|nr:hypothetical protein I4U23_009782 [Adineta vaga]